MTTPKWMIGLMACAAFLIADCDREIDEDCGCPQSAVTLDEE